MQSKPTCSHKYFIIILIFLMTPMCGIGIDIYSPSLPAIVSYFHTNISLVKLTIPVYLISYGIGHLILGTLSDSLGRKKILIVMVILFILTCIYITFLHNIHLLLFIRMLQGFAVAGPGVIFKSLLTDSFQGKQLQKIIAYNSIVWSLGPIIAPFIGGYLQFYFGWWASFYFLAIYGTMVLLIALFFLPETNKNPVAFNVVTIAKNYRTIVSNKFFMVGLIGVAITYSVLVIFNIIGPFLIQDVMHYSAVDYGHIALLLGIFGFMGPLSNRLLINVYSRDKIILSTIGCALFISLLMIIMAEFWQLNLVILLIPVGLIFYLAAMSNPNFAGLCLSQFPEMAGSASALMGFLFMTVTFIITSLASLLKSSSEVPLAIAYGILMAVCLLIYLGVLFKRTDKCN